MSSTDLLSVFAYPLGVIFLLIAGAALLRIATFRRTAFSLSLAAAALLWAASTPVAARWAYWHLERQYPPIPISELADFEVAILLGGATVGNIPPRQAVEVNQAADRIVHAADLFRAGKVERIIVSGGATPFTSQSEAERGAILLEKLGVPGSAIILEKKARNTRENAVFVAEIWRDQGIRSGLLVTSAGHMPRSLASFRKVGLPVAPSSADVEVALPLSRSVLDWLPDASGLLLSQMTAHELVGYAVYRFKGWAA